MPDREKLIELLNHQFGKQVSEIVADWLIANGVTIQSDVIERLSKGMSRLRTMMLGHDKAFDERMAGYDPSAFCVGFDYAMQLAMGLLTQLPEPPNEGEYL